MTLQEFCSKYIGTYIDHDGAYGPQCVDLSKRYSKEIFGVSLGRFGIGPVTGWKNQNNTFPFEHFQKILNTPSNFPLAGDQIIFGTTGANIFGHIAIVVSADRYKINVFEQNGDIGQGGTVCKYNTYDYTGKKIGKVLGWFRKK